jgi:hypothetical protein
VIDTERIDRWTRMAFWLFLAHFGAIGRGILLIWRCFGREKRESVVSDQWSVVSDQLSVISDQWSVVSAGCQLSAFGARVVAASGPEGPDE